MGSSYWCNRIYIEPMPYWSSSNSCLPTNSQRAISVNLLLLITLACISNFFSKAPALSNVMEKAYRITGIPKKSTLKNGCISKSSLRPTQEGQRKELQQTLQSTVKLAFPKEKYTIRLLRIHQKPFAPGSLRSQWWKRVPDKNSIKKQNSSCSRRTTKQNWATLDKFWKYALCNRQCIQENGLCAMDSHFGHHVYK